MINCAFILPPLHTLPFTVICKTIVAILKTTDIPHQLWYSHTPDHSYVSILNLHWFYKLWFLPKLIWKILTMICFSWKTWGRSNQSLQETILMDILQDTRCSENCNFIMCQLFYLLVVHFKDCWALRLLEVKLFIALLWNFFASLIIFFTKEGCHSLKLIVGVFSITGKLCGIWPLQVKLLLARGTKDKPAASSQGAIGRLKLFTAFTVVFIWPVDRGFLVSANLSEVVEVYPKDAGKVIGILVKWITGGDFVFTEKCPTRTQKCASIHTGNTLKSISSWVSLKQK